MTIEVEQAIVEYSDNSATVRSITRKGEAFSQQVESFDTRQDFSITINFFDTQIEVPIVKDHSIENDNYVLPEKIISVSDVEGNFEELARFLLATNVISENFKWTFDVGHLVVLGDIFDRGKYVNECLWLLYKLEQEAELAGGKVHLVLGNHEAMNLTGIFDKRMLSYVHAKFYANADFLNFEYEKWYASNTELGLWLRSKNAVEKIGGYVFVHGGISPKLAAAQLDITQINNIVRQNLDKSPKSHSQIEQLVLRGDGPLWYRGLAKEHLSDIEVNSILQTFDAEKIIFGHTIVGDRMTALYDGRAMAIDLPHAENKTVAGLLIDANGFYEISDTGDKRAIGPE